MEVMASLHGRVGWALVLYYTAAGVWGLYLGARGTGLTPSFRGAVVIAEIAAIAQGLLGFVVLAFVRPPLDSLHILYGFALVLAMPLAATLIRERTPRGQAVALGFAALFTAGLAIRAITTSG